jgi:glutamine synthetase
MNTQILILEYIWIDGHKELRSKTRIVYISSSISLNDISFDHIPNWSFDGSSTFQADINEGNTEILLYPVHFVKDPLRKSPNSFAVLCECRNIFNSQEPISNNSRYEAKKIFENYDHLEPWFGLEQEYYFESPSFLKEKFEKQYYCTTTSYCSIEKTIVEEHLQACLYAGLRISGINAEVGPSQWEFQIGPCNGIDVSDSLYLARFFLERIAEKYNYRVSYHPKPDSNLSGSGCHINFSTNIMRSENGLPHIEKAIHNLSLCHHELLEYYGQFNYQRLTGLHETASYHTFSYGIGTRNTSIRIGVETFMDKKGYFEDRPPAANIDPYLATSMLLNFACTNVDSSNSDERSSNSDYLSSDSDESLSDIVNQIL